MNVGKQHSNSFPRSKRPSITKETNEVLKGERLLDNLARLSKNEINKRDIFGRSLAHLAASSGRTDLMSAVCENLHVDLMAADYENGWTPMHVALAAGNLGCAQILLSHCPEVIKSKDRDHSSPMEIINSMLQVKVEHWDRDDSDKGTNHLFMFGSNANHNLGFADSDNRSNPEMAKIKRNVEHTVPRFRFHPINIRDVQLSKLHSAIITGDLKDNLMVCGIPRGGRLGLNSTAFTFTHVPGFRKERVISVALGLDHTVAVTESGGCYTWGSNHYCQLGYNLSENNITTNNNNIGSLNMMGSSNSNNIQPTPRKLGGDLKKLNIIGCSASNIHTVVFTSFEMFSWGKNNGQLGFPTDKEFESVPRKVLHLSHSVTMVKATDIATIVLLENGDVWVFMNGGRFKVQFPSERRNDTFDIFTPRIPPSSIVKIAASLGGQVCALDSNGSIFGFNLSPFYKRNNAELSTRNIMRNLKVTKLWFGRKAHLRARDVDIGDDGSIMLCTESGSVWRLSGKKKFRRVPLINRIQQVRCDSSFSSFAAVREELKLSPIGISSISLGDDFHFLVPFVDNDNNRKVDELMRQQSEKEDNKIAYSFFSLEHNPLDDTSAVNSKAASDRCQHIVRWLSSCSDDSAVKMGISSSDDSSNTCHDMFFSTQGVRLGVHKCFIYCRVPVLATMSINDCLYVNNSRKLYIEKNLLVFEGFQLTTLVIFVYYLYTDNLLAVWDAPVKTSPKHINVSKEELIELGRVLKLTDLCVAIQRHCQPYHNISDDSMKLKNQQSTADIVIHLKDDELYYCHSFILCSRSALFSNMLAARWGRLKDANRLIEVDLQNIDLETFEIVIHHLYGDRIFDLFDCVKGESSKAFINFVLKVLYAADYLLLPKLSEICQSILLNFATVKNAGWMLNEIADISSKELESGLMDLICHNSECILENGFLDIPQDLFNKVDDAARNFIQRQAPSDKAFFSFQEDFESYNEDLTSMAPIYGVKTHSSISTFRDKNAMALKTLEKNFATPNNCNEGSNEEDIFELEMEERLSKGKEKLTSSSVTGGLSKGNAENAMIKHSSNTGIPSSPTMSLWNNRPGKDHNSPKSSPGQNWSTVSRGSSLYQSPGLDRMSPNNSGESSSSLKTPVRRIVATSSSGSSWQNFKKSPAEYSQKGSSSSSPSSLTSMFAGSKSAKPVTQQQTIHSPNQCGASSKSVSTPQTSSSTPVTYITPEITEFPLGKLSQKERRKLQRERAPSTGESSSSSPAWGLPNLIKPSKPVWNTVNTTSTIGSVPKATTATTITANLDTSTSEFTRNNNSISPGAGKFENNSHTESSNSTTPTLADIIRQEQQIVRIQASQATKSLKDIQQEEAFQKWWSKESQKFQRLQKESSSGGQNNKENIVNGDGHKYNKRRHRPRKNNSNKSQTTVGV